MVPKRGFVPEDLWDLKTVSDPRVSPDGLRVAYVAGAPDRQTDKAATSIWVAGTDGGQPPRPFTSGPADHSPRWSPDGRWLAYVSERDGVGQLYVASLEGGEGRPLTTAVHGVSQPVWSPDGTRLAYVARTGEWVKPEARTAIERSAPRVVTGLYHRYDGLGWLDERRSHLFVVGVDGGECEQLTTGDYDHADPDWAPDGVHLAFVSDRAATRFDETHRDVWVTATKGPRRRRPRRLTGGVGNASSPRWSPDGTRIAYIGHHLPDGDSASNTHLMVIDADGGGAARSLSASLDRTVWGMLRPPGRTHQWADDGDSVDFLVVDGGSCALYRTQLDGGAPELVAGGDRQIVTFDRTGATVAFVAQWPTRPPEVYCVDADGGRERLVSNANAALASIRWAPLKRVHHRSSDGRRIESFVMLPPGGAKAGPRPMVLEIHGGPHGWHPQVVMLGLYQCLASAGYVVVLPNPRGSHGYGEEFSRACVGDWGGGDYQDLMTVVDALVADGTADPDRLYVAGYSYGGYMTGWAVGHTDRFAAACVSAPVVDLLSMWGTTDIPNFEEFETGGLPWEIRDRFVELSPLTYLPNVTTPVALFHWDGDLRCPIGQSEEFFQALRKLGREVVLVRYPGGFHIVRSPSQMVDYVTRHIDWFAAH